MKPTHLSTFAEIIQTNSDYTVSSNQEGSILVLADASGGSLTITVNSIKAGNLLAIVKTDTSTNSVTVTGNLSATLTSSNPSVLAVTDGSTFYTL